ncbi:MAG: amino acid adenylation domain-containing protein [Candidatus Acidiferrales bacterium]
MKTIGEFLSRLRTLDIRLTLDGERLNVNAAPGVLTPSLKSELASRKEEIKVFLRKAVEAARAGVTGIPRVDRSPDLPVSFCQQRLWFLDQMEPGNAAYNIAGALRLTGKLNSEALEHSISEIIRRHEGLRMRFVNVDGTPRSVIDPAGQWRLARTDLSYLAPSEREADVLHRATVAAQQPFDLARGPLIRASLLRLDETSHVLLLAMHHIVSDGWSLGVFIREFGELYAAYVTGENPILPALPIQYADFAQWQRQWLAKGVLDAQLPYWKEQLGGSLPVLQLPTDRPRPKIQSLRGSRLVRIFPKSLADELKALSRKENVTLFMLLLAAFQVLLHRYTGEEDILVGSPTANRSRAEIENLIGFFVNTLVLRTDLSGNPTVHELLARVREVALKAYAHQDVPFDVLVEVLRPRRELDHSPLFQVLFVLQNLPFTELALPDLVLRPIDIEPETARFDVAVDIVDRPEGLKIYFEYNSELFNLSTAQRMVDHLRILLEGFVARPGARISDLSMLTETEQRQLVEDWNRTEADYPREKCVQELFEEQANLAPDTTAVVFGGARLSYRELNEKANRLARHLKRHGVGPDSLVGVWVERSLEMVVALLGVLKAGAAYVPLDPSFPKERLEFMVNDSQLSVILTQGRLAVNIPEKAATHVVRLDADWEKIASEAGTNLPASAKPQNLAYVIYTSGSTGKPKGVQLEHSSVVNFLKSMQKEPGLSARDRLVSVTTLSFDIAGLEIYGPLTVGAQVILASRATALDGMQLAALLEDSQATVMQATPATWRLLLEAGWRGLPGLRIFCGGEALPRELADKLLAAGAEVWNLYGPTETTIWSTVARVESGDAYPSIGRPIANTSVYLLDAQRKPVPVGVPGEIYIGGDGLARGYLNRPELTAEKFVPDPFRDQPGARMYRTGDLGRYLLDGTIQCLGRVDHQVKIRGFRIELGEIETLLVKAPGVSQSVVAAREDGSGAQRLIAYVIAQPGSQPDPGALRAFLAQQLPEYMVPSIFMTLESFPLTPNGKVDRKALPTPDGQRLIGSTTYVSPGTETERSLAEVWQEVLKVGKVGLHDNFFDLGGHSLLVVQVQSRLRKRLNREVTLVDLFQRPTVGSLAEFLDSHDDAAASFANVRERAEKQREALGKMDSLA